MKIQENPKKKVLMIFIEPAPYILGIINAIVPLWAGQIDVLFLKENASQSWGLELPKHFAVLPVSGIKAAYFLWQCLFKKKYALIHVAGWSNPVCLLLILLSRFIHIPVTVESDTQLNLDLPLWKKIIKRIVYPLLFKLPVLFFAGGTRQIQYFQHYGVKSEKIVMMQMTVDVEAIQDQGRGITTAERTQLRYQHKATGASVVFLFVGRLLKWKGLHELIAAFKAMERPNAQLWIVGDGELKLLIETVTTQHKSIHYFGRLSGRQLIAVYSAADVVVVPSHFEPWGLVVNEAMSAGKPVIASDQVGCTDDLVYSGKTGLIVRAKSVASLCAAMQWMIDSPDQRQKMAKAASAHIASWTLENEANNIIRGWQGILSSI